MNPTLLQSNDKGLCLSLGRKARVLLLPHLLSRAVILLLYIFFTTTLINAQWQMNGVAVCDTAPNRIIFTFPRIAPDGLHGAYICWRDIRNGDLDIYAQRIDSSGRIQWQHNGIPIARIVGAQNFPRIASDSQGNAFVAWEDGRATNTFPYVQKLNRNGQTLWQTNGVKAAEAPGIFISIAADERGGCVLAWTDGDNVFAQRLDSTGRRTWSNNAVQLTNRPEPIYPGDVAIASDGSGGAVVAWSEGDYRLERIYAQRIDSVGKTLWTTNGVQLSDSSSNITVALAYVPTGQIIVTWVSESKLQKYVQKLDTSGKRLWNPNGIVLEGIGGGGGGEPRTTSDRHGGAFVGHGKRIQHLDSTGKKMWNQDGVLFITAEIGSTNSTQTFDGNQGVFNFTEFVKDGEGWLILAQWIDGRGLPRFGPDGKKMTPGIANGRQFNPVSIGDGRGAAIVCWNDNRNNTSAVYVARIDTTGVITSVHPEGRQIPAAPVLEQNYPNPFNPETTIEYEIPARGAVQLIIYDTLGREVLKLVNEQQEAGFYRVTWNGKNSRGEKVSSGPYYYRLLFNNNVPLTKKFILLR